MARAYRGQATLEFLMAFTATVAMVLLVAAALNAQEGEAEGKARELTDIGAVEGAVRAVEAATANGGMSFDFRDEDVFYRVEGGKFRVAYGGKTIEKGGVFANETAEPI
jgi:hypothetical protein